MSSPDASAAPAPAVGQMRAAGADEARLAAASARSGAGRAPGGEAGADEARLAEALERDVRAVLGALAGSAVEELRIERGGVRIAVRRDWQPAAAEPAASGVVHVPAPLPAAAPEPARTEVRAQMVGVFHRARAIDSPVLASGGDHVEPGQPLGVIETLGMANDVEAPAGGRLGEFAVQDGEAVEYGELLAVIEDE